jgi:hypothetical protein
MPSPSKVADIERARILLHCKRQLENDLPQNVLAHALVEMELEVLRARRGGSSLGNCRATRFAAHIVTESPHD